MRLDTAIELYAGGKGSGCNPDAGVCGRPKGSGKGSDKSEGGEKKKRHYGRPDHLKDKARQARAKLSHKPINKAVYRAAKASEEQLAKVLGGISFRKNNPFDVFLGAKIGIEVKTLLDPTAEDRVNLRKASRMRKEKQAKQMGLKKVYMVAFDYRFSKKPTIYVKEGIGAYRLKTMSVVKNMKELKQHIGAI